jgi:Rrf2 family nitric oxide-sensitive transcriptional repressor
MFSQTAEYALRAIVTLAQGDAGGKTAQDIARESQVPLDYLSKVLNLLARSGILHAQRGRRGGFTLTIPPARITVLDVVNAVDPIRRIRSCPLHLSAHKIRMCALHRKLDEALALVEEAFATTTIASLCEEPLTAGCEEPLIAGPAAVEASGDFRTDSDENALNN